MVSNDIYEPLSPLSSLHCSHPKGYHKPLSGKSNTGEWNTGQAAAYPEALASALANALPPIADKRALSNIPISIAETANPLPYSETVKLNETVTTDKMKLNTPASLNSETQGAYILPKSHLPNKACNENDGRGWDVDIVRTRGKWAECKFSNYDTTEKPDTGNPWIKIDNLLPIDSQSQINTNVCAIIPNSRTGRALQAIANIPDITSPKGRKTAMKQNKERAGSKQKEKK